MSFFNKMIEIAKSMGVKNFAFYKKWALDHLKKQLDEEETVTKALEYCEEYLEKAYGVGTIREWKGKKYIKGPDKKWRRYYEKHGRGANQAIKSIMRQINALEDGDVEGLYAIIQQNAGRFRDPKTGQVLPEVQQIHDLVDKKQSGSGKKEKDLSPLQKYENSIRDEKYEQARKDAEMRNQNSDIEKYKKLQDELKQEIADGKRNNTKELQEDVNEWKNLLSIAEKRPGSYSKEQTEHFREIIKIGEAELSKRKKGKAKKEEMIDGPYGRKFTIDEAKKEIEGQIRYLKEMKENIGKQPKGRLAKDTESFIENLMGKLKPEDRTDLETMYDEYKNGGKEKDTHYWIQDPKGNRLTNIEAKERIKNNLDQIDSFNDLMEGRSKAENARTEIAKRSLEVDNNRLMERLNAEDRKEMKSEFEKHQNRSNAMKGNQNAKKDGISDEELKKMTNFQLRKRLNELEGQEDNGDYKKLQDELNKREKEEDAKDLQANVEGIKNKLEGKSETEVKKYFNWLDKQFADKPEDSIEKRAIAQAKNDYYGNTSFKGTVLETVVEKYANDKDIKNLIKKTDSMSFTSNDETRAFMSGTYQEDGYQVATDGVMLSMIKTDYPAEEEGKIKGNEKILKYNDKKIEQYKVNVTEAEDDLKRAAETKGTGSRDYEFAEKKLTEAKESLKRVENVKKTGFMDGTFPNYKKVIPSLGSRELISQDGFEDFDKVLKTAMVATAYKKQTKSLLSYVRVGNKVFDAERLSKVMAIVKKHGLNEVVTYPGEGSPVEFKGENGSVVIMPMTRSDEVKDGEFDANTGKVNIENQDKADEFLTAGEKETKITKYKKINAAQAKMFSGLFSDVRDQIYDIFGIENKPKKLSFKNGLISTPEGRELFGYEWTKEREENMRKKWSEQYGNEKANQVIDAIVAAQKLKAKVDQYQTDMYDEEKKLHSSEVENYIKEKGKEIKSMLGMRKSFLEQIEEISKSSNRSHLVKKQVTDKNGRVRTVWVNPLDKEQMKKRKADMADLRDFTGKEKEKAIIEDAIKEVLGGEIEKMRNIDFPKDASKNMYMVDMNYDTIKSKMKNATQNLKAALEKKGVKVVGDVRDNHFDAHWEFSKKYPAIHRFSFYLENSQETKKSFLDQVIEISKSVNGEKQSEQKHDLEYYKKWAMSILDKQEETVDEPNEETVVKALEYCEMMLKAGYPVGTIREWKGQKYIKIAPNKWKPKYDNMGSRGAKMSLSNLKKAVAKCNSEEELFNLINSNASRFRDENGHPFPEVQELHDLVQKRSGEIENNNQGSNSEESVNNGSTPKETEEQSEKNGKSDKKTVSEKISDIQKMGKKAEGEIDKLGNGNVEGVAADAGDDTVNAVKNAAKEEEKKPIAAQKTSGDVTSNNFSKLQLNQAYNMVGMKGSQSLEQFKEHVQNAPETPKNKAALMIMDKIESMGDTQETMDKIYEAIQNGTLDSLGNNSKEEPAEETFESLTEQYNATKDPDEREKLLNKIMSLEKEKNDTIKDMKEETYEDMGYSEKTKEEIDNMDRAEFSEYMRREQKSIPMDKIGRGGGRITNFDNAYNVCKKIAETYGVSDEGVKKLQDFMTYNTDTASRLHDELNEKMGMSYELLDADYDMAYKNALKQLLGKKTNGDSDKEKAAVDKYQGNLGAAARKYL